MLRLEHVRAGYGNILAIKDISLVISEGEIVTLIGANGAGKSTTLMTISGLVPCRGGKILLNGREIQGEAPDNIVRLGLSQVPEGRHIFPLLTVKENLDMGAFLRRDKDGVKRDLEFVYTLFPILEKRQRQHGGALSGGEQQMLAMSRALMARPKMLLLDEPSMGLAPLLIKQIFAIIERLNRERGTTIFLVEQNARKALRVAHRGYVLENGEIIVTGTGRELAANEKVQSAYLGM
ncbi:MAG: ABC transporter ATP-binding protein [Desulfobulbaceae bacterium]|jgi:branched-chain amino acid transport system ATP-binding protein|nr:ABC transporter ATP-binding protein [Desulfobulbaceae bacterium]